jgi:histidinol-phosphate aminotransferase
MIKPNNHLKNIYRDSDIFLGRDGLIGLDRNERVSPFSDAVMRDIFSTVQSSDLSLYPDLGKLYSALSEFTGLPVPQLCLGAGSDGLIRRTFQVFLSPGDRVVAPDPTYRMYQVWSDIFQGQYCSTPYNSGPEFSFNMDEYLKILRKGAKICCIANPDQPTGSTLSMNELRLIAKEARKGDTLFLIDEAYYPFHKDTAFELLRDFDNVLITRTFSKVGGIAGLRVGYAMGAKNIIAALNTTRSPGEVNSLGVHIATYLLHHTELMSEFKNGVEQGRVLLLDAAKELGYIASKCPANFQMLKVPQGLSPALITAGLQDRGYLIKGNMSHPSLIDYIRITLDIPDIMNPFIKHFKEVTNSLKL